MHERCFEAFVTVDQNVEFQQNVGASGIAVAVLAARLAQASETTMANTAAAAPHAKLIHPGVLRQEICTRARFCTCALRYGTFAGHPAGQPLGQRPPAPPGAFFEDRNAAC